MIRSILLALLILGPAAGYFAFSRSADSEREQALSEFDEHLLVQVSRLRENTLAIAESLYSLRAFFESSDVVSRQEFAIFTGDMRKRQPTILAAEWIPWIPAEEREAHESAAQADGLQNYELKEKGTGRTLRPVRLRQEYFPVYFAEPHQGNESALGFDLGSEPIRREALLRAVRTGDVALSDPVDLVQEKSDCFGILAVIPIGATRESTPLGFALIEFRIDDLIRHSLFGGHTTNPSGLPIRLTDLDVGSHEQVICESEGFADGTGPEARAAAIDLAVGGQRWRLDGRPTNNFLAARSSRHPILVGFIVFLIWELCFGSLYLLERWSKDRSLLEQTRAEATVQHLSSALEQTADMVYITNQSGTFEYVNPAFVDVLGYSRSETLGKKPRIMKSGKHGEDYYDSLWSTLLAGEVFRSETVNRKKSGELIHIEQTITPMRDPQGQTTHFVSVSKDMTEKRKRREHDIALRLAAMVQKKLYPAVSPKVKGLTVAGAVFSAEATCGDYFDYVTCADGALAVAIGDVSGHGLGPALLMAETRAYLRPLLRSHEELDAAFHILNQLISEDLESGRFVTLLTAKFDREGRSLSYSSAGHIPGYIFGRNGRLKLEMDPTGPALGILEQADFSMSEVIAVEPGDVILFLTDGVTESRAPDGSFFGEKAAMDLVRDHRHESPREIVDRLHQAASAFTQSETRIDDITIVVVKVEEHTTDSD